MTMTTATSSPASVTFSIYEERAKSGSVYQIITVPPRAAGEAGISYTFSSRLQAESAATAEGWTQTADDTYSDALRPKAAPRLPSPGSRAPRLLVE